MEVAPHSEVYSFPLGEGKLCLRLNSSSALKNVILACYSAAIWRLGQQITLNMVNLNYLLVSLPPPDYTIMLLMRISW
jgi:hypothetical protein